MFLSCSLRITISLTTYPCQTNLCSDPLRQDQINGSICKQTWRKQAPNCGSVIYFQNTVTKQTFGNEGLIFCIFRHNSPAHSNFTTTNLHNVYIYYTLLLHVSAVHFRHFSQQRRTCETYMVNMSRITATHL